MIINLNNLNLQLILPFHRIPLQLNAHGLKKKGKKKQKINIKESIPK